MIVGYARTSTAEQHAGLEAQKRDLMSSGAERVYSEQISSVAPRKALHECLAYVREGDAVMVTKPDRLARSTVDLLKIEADLSRRGVGLIVLSMGGERLDTRNPTSKLMLTILAGVATWEREIMLERQREGIAKAQADGKYKGRAPTVMRQADEIRALVEAGGKPTHVARSLGIARSSLYRVMQASIGSSPAASVERLSKIDRDLKPAPIRGAADSLKPKADPPPATKREDTPRLGREPDGEPVRVEPIGTV